jgi:hypothetical protein
MGIGPVCRARDNKQGGFDFLKHERGKYIFVRSVTNDADHIAEQLCLDFDITGDTRIFSHDSDGQIDELLHTGMKFGHECIDIEEAI